MKNCIWLTTFFLIASIVTRAADAPSKFNELQSAADIVVQVDAANQWTILKPLPPNGAKPPALSQRGFAESLGYIQHGNNLVVVVLTIQLQAQETPEKSIARLHPFFSIQPHRREQKSPRVS